MPSSANLALGPGKLFYAPIGTAEPTDITTALPVAWLEIGYTSEGSEISYEMSTEPVEVAESLDPLFYRTNSRSGTVNFAMAENTTRNLTLAFNGGTVTSTGTAPNVVWTYEPPAPGTEVRRMLLWESEDRTERWVIRQVYQTGAVGIARRKGSEYATLPVEFAIEAPATGLKPFKAMYTAARAGGATVST